jgi:hypothetical protein
MPIRDARNRFVPTAANPLPQLSPQDKLMERDFMQSLNVPQPTLIATVESAPEVGCCARHERTTTAARLAPFCRTASRPLTLAVLDRATRSSLHCCQSCLHRFASSRSVQLPRTASPSCATAS